MVTVLCVRFGKKYGVEYVEKLRNMVSRHLSIPYEFVCLTDDPTPIDGVKLIVQPNAGYAKGWWHKVHMFDPDLNISGRILYLDLDVVIHSNINKLVENYSNEFLGIRDFNRKFTPNWNKLNSSAISWIGGQYSNIFIDFKKYPREALALHGDQDWIWKRAGNKITFWPDSWILSYKWEVRSRNEINFGSAPRTFKTIANPMIPKDCSICVFHGDPNPHDVKDPYVIDNWH